MMDHQNIARIFDAGTTEDGSPFFAMELIEGVKLSRYCDTNKLSIPERLQLMIPVCMAVQHAHQKGIIHRDLKHSNVLVTKYDGQAVPKIIDFGLAKALKRQELLTDKTLNSELGKIVGTIQYMSPEQASLSDKDVDTRTDIYSLGAMIYKLLTGSTPVRKRDLKKSTIIKLLNEIQHSEPELPSSRLENSSQLDELAKLRNTLPERLKPTVQGDLDWILNKALASDRNRRYETAYGLALDLERYLNNEPVRARPPSSLYNIQKFVVRNSRLVASMVAILFLLVAGILGTSFGLKWALNERDRANTKSEEALAMMKEAMLAEREARESEARRKIQQQTAESRLRAIRIKSAWSDWQLGNTNFAWQMLNEISEDEFGWENQFLCAEFSSSEKTLYGNASSVESVALSPNEKFIGTGSTDHQVRIWDTKTLKPIHTAAASGAISCSVFSKDSKRFIVGDLSNRISIFETESGKLLKTLGPFPTDVLSIAIFDDNKIVAGFAHRNSRLVLRVREHDDPVEPMVRIFDLDNDDTAPIELAAHTKDIAGVAATEDGSTIVSCSFDESIVIWRLNGDTYEKSKTIIGHREGVHDVEISPDESTFATCGKDMTIRVWSLNEGEQIRSLVGHQDHVLDIEYSRDGTRIGSASHDRTAKVWDLTGKAIRTCNGHFDSVCEVVFSANGNFLYSASEDQTIRLWDATTKPGTIVTEAHKNVIWQADILADKKTVVSASEDGTVQFTDLSTGKPTRQELKFDEALLCVKSSPVSDLVAIGGASNDLWVLETPNGKVKTIPAHNDYIWDIDISNDGTKLVTAIADKTARIWDTSDWSMIGELKGHTGELGSARFSPDNRYIVTGSDDTTIRLWDAKSFELVKTFEKHKMGVWRAIFSPNGNLIASSSYDGDIIIWNVEQREFVRLIEAHNNQVAGLSFSKDGSRIASASDDQTIKIWEVRTGIELFALRDKNDSPIVHVSFSPDGMRMISGNGEGWLTIRTATNYSPDQRPKLPQDALEYAVVATELIHDPKNKRSEYQKLLKESLEWSGYFPNYDLYTVCGIAQYRLGEFEAAEQNLSEALRLEDIVYGEADLRPAIDAYLALAYHQNGKLELANKIRKQFERKANRKRWNDDEPVQRIANEINATFERNAETVARSE